MSGARIPERRRSTAARRSRERLSMSRLSACPASMALCLLLAGCQALGPTALGIGRGAYNDVIPRTEAEQTLGLIVRVLTIPVK